MCSLTIFGFQGFYLVKNIFKIPSPVPDVPHDPPGKIQNKSGKGHSWALRIIPGKSCVCISVNKEFEMEEVPQPREVEHEDALDQDHVRGVDGGELARGPRIGFEVVHWHLCLPSVYHVRQDRLHQLVVKCVRVVKVEGALHRLGRLGRRELPVEGVLAQDHNLLLLGIHLTLSKLIDEGGADGGLSGRSATRHPDHEGRSHGRRHVPSAVVARHTGAVLRHLDQIFLKYMPRVNWEGFLFDCAFKLS